MIEGWYFYNINQDEDNKVIYDHDILFYIYVFKLKYSESV